MRRVWCSSKELLLQSGFQLTFLSVIRQDFSWSPFLITFPTIKKIHSHHHICPAFITMLQDFGSKVREDERFRDGYNSQILNTEEGNSSYGR